MGVPAFFRKFIKKYDIIRDDPDKPIKSLYIDANCLFHPQCFKILDIYKNEKNQKRIFDKMTKRILKFIDYLIRLTNPTDLIYIAVDGVAPLAKINQQRSRRFNSANNYRHDVYRKYGIEFNETWSNVVITPGTQFMYDLHMIIKTYYESKANNNCKIIYDSYLTAGEGEHKILQHIKANVSLTEENATIIYGLDADLIFLSLASQIPNIYLLRETDQFSQNEDTNNNSIEVELCYVDIECAKKSINDEFNEYYKKFTCSDELIDTQKFNFTNDYIFICYFLGNDFLPHLPSIDINIDGLDILFNVYIDVFTNLGRCLITYNKNKKIKIDDEFLKEFLTIISTKEEDFFKRLLPKHLYKHNKKRCFEREPYKKDIWNIDNLKIFDITDKIMLGQGEAKEWKARYYSHYFHTSMNETVTNICHNYIEGLLWVARYYFEECPSWRWQYKFTHAPFLSDIIEYIKTKNIMKDFNTMKEKNVDIYTQLVSVIPPLYSNILPKELQYLNHSIKSPIVDMFPLTYKLDMINKTQYYKCIPMIPYLDINRVENALKSIKLSKNDIQKSILIEPFVF